MIKQITALVMFAALMLFALALTVHAKIPQPFDPDTDYAWEMICAASEGDVERGRELEKKRNAKKEFYGITDNLTFDDLYLLAKVVEAEAGGDIIEDEHKELVASVVINRMNSPEFPNTLHDVIYEKGQYAMVHTNRFKNLIPSQKSSEIASDIIQYGSIAPASVVFQSEFRLGSGIYKSFAYKEFATTYFCYSSSPELYESED